MVFLGVAACSSPLSKFLTHISDQSKPPAYPHRGLKRIRSSKHQPATFNHALPVLRPCFWLESSYPLQKSPHILNLRSLARKKVATKRLCHHHQEFVAC